MKKMFIIILILVYSFPTIGFSCTIHYCGGQFSSMSLGFSNTKSCGCDPKFEKKGCCDNKTITFKNDSKHQKTEQFKVAKTELVVEQINFNSVLDSVIRFPNETDYSNCFRAPPPLPKNTLFILFNVFRI